MFGGAICLWRSLFLVNSSKKSVCLPTVMLASNIRMKTPILIKKMTLTAWLPCDEDNVQTGYLDLFQRMKVLEEGNRRPMTKDEWEVRPLSAACASCSCKSSFSQCFKVSSISFVCHAQTRCMCSMCGEITFRILVACTTCSTALFQQSLSW
jgi:hypothetical protein